jgi:hypothetical protein
MQENQKEFFTKLGEKLEAIKALVKMYEYEDEFAMAFIGGLYSENEEGEIKFHAVSDYVVEDEEELDEMLSACLDIFRLTEGMTADQKAELPEDVKDTKNWTQDDWMRFISDNTKGES